MTNGGDMFSFWPMGPAKPDAGAGQRPANVFPFSTQPPAERPSMPWLTSPAQTAPVEAQPVAVSMFSTAAEVEQPSAAQPAPQGWDEPEPERGYPWDFPEQQRMSLATEVGSTNEIPSEAAGEPDESEAEDDDCDDPLPTEDRFPEYTVIEMKVKFSARLNDPAGVVVTHEDLESYWYTEHLTELRDDGKITNTQWRTKVSEYDSREEEFSGAVLVPVVKHLLARGFICTPSLTKMDYEDAKGDGLTFHAIIRTDAVPYLNATALSTLCYLKAKSFNLAGTYVDKAEVFGKRGSLNWYSDKVPINQRQRIGAEVLYQKCNAGFDQSNNQWSEFLNYEDETGQWWLDQNWPTGWRDDREPIEDWLARVALTEDDIRQQVQILEMTGGDPFLYDSIVGTPETNKEVEWVVDGVAARGAVTLVCGQEGIGKSTLLHELCFKVGRISKDPADFLGAPVWGNRVAAMAFGEDPASIVFARKQAFESTFGRSLVVQIMGPWSIEELVAKIDAIPRVDLFVLDPVRSFLDGGESDNDAVSRFYKPLCALAERKNCAIIVSHHVGKEKAPTDIRGVVPRGAQTFKDRSRLIFGMVRRRNGVIGLGVIKTNFPPSAKLWGDLFEQRLFVQDESTLSLLPLAGQTTGKPGPATKVDESGDLRVAVDALRRLTEAGEVVHRTGASELFNRQCEELAGWSRARVRKAVQAAIDAGMVTNPEDGSGLHVNNFNTGI
ncbi:AAA family ATPase [Novosphingobium sp. AAP93]|uniref:AAA family ATPase n=1 Tax=Novosphingobium sp. AAP93 TaxID=1523427 RepID=UPI0006B88502|nr:AAA family ATPase [Novosphingobium sp. AAP93]KPF81423.1 hypothetical protein IP83_13345 [Novosphingobium sp. AAP93]